MPNAELYYKEALANIYAGKYKAAIVDILKAISINPEIALYHVVLGRIQNYMSNPAKALESFEKALTIDPTCADAYLERGRRRDIDKNIEGALSDYEKAIYFNKDLEEAYIRKALMYVLYRKDLPQALLDYTEAIRINPKNATTYLNRGRVLFALGEKANAVDDFDSAIRGGRELAPETIWKVNINIILYELNKLITENPKFTKAYILLGLTYAFKREYLKAIAEFSSAIELDHNDCYIYFHRGNAYYRLDDFVHALQDFDKSIELCPNDPKAYISRGILLRSLGEIERAVNDFEYVLNFYPEHPHVEEIGLQEIVEVLKKAFPKNLP